MKYDRFSQDFDTLNFIIGKPAKAVQHGQEEGQWQGRQEVLDDEAAAFERVAAEYVKAAELLAEVLKGGQGSGNWGHAGRPGSRGGSAPGGGSGFFSHSEATNLSSNLAESGGFTYQPLMDTSPSDGFMVSPYKDRETVISTSEVSTKTLSRYVAQNKDLLSKSDHFLGGWVDGDKTYLDISVHLSDKSAAQEFAIRHAQLAYFDLANMETVYVQ